MRLMDPLAPPTPAARIPGLLATLAAILVCTSHPMPALAGTSACFDYGDAFGDLGGILDGHSIIDIEVSGSRAYVLSYLRGSEFSVLDIQARPPERVGRLPLRGSAAAVAVRGALACVVTHENEVLFIDVTDASAPRELGRVSTTGTGFDLAFVGDRVLIADSYSGLVVVDASDPSRPRVVSLRRELRLGWIEVAGPWLYGTDGANFHVVDVSNPDAPVVRASVPCPGGHLQLDGNRACLAWRQISVVDISVPTAPQVLASAPLRHEVQRLRVAGGRAFGAAGQRGLVVIDVSRPDPRPITAVDGIGYARAVALAGDRVLVGTDVGLRIRDATWPQPPPPGRLDTEGFAVAVAGQGATAYVADGDAGLAIADLSDPRRPALHARFDTDGNAQGVAVAGSLAFVADFDAGLTLVDVADPSRPSLRGRVDTPGRAMSVAVADSFAYVADLGAGLQVVAVGDPTRPRIVGNARPPGRPSKVAAVQHRVYVLDPDVGVHAIDARVPSAPILRGSRYGPAFDLAAGSGHVFIAAGERGVEIVDFEAPGGPAVVATVPALGTVRQIALADRFLLAADEAWAGFTVFDVSNPEQPLFVGRALVGSEVQDLAIAGDLAIMARGDSGLAVAPAHCDIETPVALSDLEALEVSGGTLIRWRAEAGAFVRFEIRRASGDGRDATAFRGIAWLGDCAPSCAFVDTEPIPPEGVAYDVVATTGSGAAVRLGPILVAASPATPLGSIRVAPNPAHRAVQFQVHAGARASLQLGIYDVAGRRLCRLPVEDATSAVRALRWMGRDAAGRRVPSGVYVARLEGRGRATSTRFVWLP